MHVLVEVDEVVVMVGPGVAVGLELGTVIELGGVVVSSSLHPNQPGVLQVEVDEELVVVVTGAEVVVSSKQPHHPGVLQVSVRVRDVDVELLILLVVVSVPLLSKNFQL